ncbi:MAG: hypothetical protein ABIP74_03825 [Candidatus Saccharimonas sp.]
MKHIKFVSLILSVIFVSVLTVVGVANAQSFKAGDNVGLAAGGTVDSALFVGGNNVNIAGTVNGDVYCAGQTISISGTVNGDVMCAGQTITVSGTINGDVRLAGQSVNLSGTVAGSATVGGQNFTIDTTGIVGRDLLGGGNAITINGKVTRDITMGAQNLTINGSVGRDINGAVDMLNVGSTGSVVGNVEYTSSNELSVATGGNVTGTVTRTEPKANQRYDMRPEMMVGMGIGSAIYTFIATIVFGLALALMFPKILENAAASTKKLPGKTILHGLVAWIVAPVVILILFLTLVGAPVALFALFAWILILMMSSSFSAYLLGKLIIDKSKSPILVMLVGVAIVAIAMMIPFLNFFVFLAAGMFGTGAIVMQAKKLFERSHTKKA